MASDVGMNLGRFLEADISDILEASCSLEESRDANIKQELKIEGGGGTNGKVILDAEEEERRLLSGVAPMKSWLFEGRMVN